MHHPWRRIRALSGWEVYFDHLPPGVNGATRWSDRTIWLRPGMTQVERRCVIEHERQHILRGPGGLGPAEERLVHIATARSLIRLADLIAAAKWALTFKELADELSVTPAVLAVRLAHLHPSERAALVEATTTPWMRH